MNSGSCLRTTSPTAVSFIAQQRLNALAWLVATGRLEVRLALRVNDEGRIRAGRMNEAIAGLVTIVVCPFVNLCEQWSRELALPGIQPVLCYGERSSSVEALHDLYTAAQLKGTKPRCVVVSSRTFLSDAFRTSLRLKLLPHLLIADEVHNLDALIAIRCLDEGIDVPDVRMAFLLASSTNPRRFIQRRGRLLRNAPGKELATIWDFIVVPPDFGPRDVVARVTVLIEEDGDRHTLTRSLTLAEERVDSRKTALKLQLQRDGKVAALKRDREYGRSMLPQREPSSRSSFH